MPRIVLQVGYVVGSFLLVGLNAILAGIALVPAGWLLLLIYERFGVTAAFVAAPFACCVWGTCLCLLVLGVKRVTLYKTRVGRFPILSVQVGRWGLVARLVDFTNVTFVGFLKGTPFVNAWFRALGARIGANVTINTTHLWDWDVLTIEDDAVLGANCVVIGHVAERGGITFAPVVVGKGATIGQNALVFPGAHLGEGAALGAQAVLPKGKGVPAGETWGGVPARNLRAVPQPVQQVTPVATDPALPH